MTLPSFPDATASGGALRKSKTNSSSLNNSVRSSALGAVINDAILSLVVVDADKTSLQISSARKNCIFVTQQHTAERKRPLYSGWRAIPTAVWVPPICPAYSY